MALFSGMFGALATERISEDRDIGVTKRKRRKFLRWVVSCIPVALMMWLNGPGIRWLGPVVGIHYLEKAGYHGSFQLEGTLAGGLVIRDVEVSGGEVLTRLRIGRLAVDYNVREVLHGKIRGLSVDGLSAAISLKEGKEKEDAAPIESQVDYSAIARTLGEIRARVIPVEVSLKDIRVDLTKRGEHVARLESSSLTHAAGSPEIRLNLGRVTGSGGLDCPPQSPVLTWKDDGILLDRLDPLAGIGVRELEVRVAGGEGASLDSLVAIDGSVFRIRYAAEGGRVDADLLEGRLASGALCKRLGVETPVSGELTSLSVHLDRLMPDPASATGDVRVLLENVRWQGKTVSELSLDAGISGNKAVLVANAKLSGKTVELQADMPLGEETGRFSPKQVQGTVKVADVPGLLTEFADQIRVLDPEIPVPPSSLNGEFSLDLDHWSLVGGTFSASLQPLDPEVATRLTVKGRVADSLQSIRAGLELEGASISGDYRFDAKRYTVSADCNGFASSRMDPWLRPFHVSVPGVVSLSGKVEGSGNLANKQHTGRLSLSRLEYTRDRMPAIHASATLQYDWPVSMRADPLVVTVRDQSVSAAVELEDGVLKINNGTWSDRDKVVASGSVILPVPEDLSNWRKSILSDKRPVTVDVESKVLPVSLLRDWFPIPDPVDPAATAMVKLKVFGPCHAPEVDLLAELKRLKSRTSSELPAADMLVKVSGRSEGSVKLDGRMTVDGYAPVVIFASMPYRPMAWLEDPESLSNEPVSARLDLPRLDVSRFASLASGVESCGGTLAGGVDVGGSVGAPMFKGKLELSKGSLVLKNRKVAPLSDLSFVVEADPQRISLTRLGATMAAGTLQAGGSMKLEGGKPGAMDFRLRADHLPVVRDSSLIVRANADLRLSGPFERASLTGSAGVVDSLFFRDIELLPVGTPFAGPSAKELPRVDAARTNPGSSVPAPFRDWTLDLRVRTVNPFLVRGNLASGEAVADVRVRGTLGSPAPSGEARIRNLQASLPFTTLNVRYGSLVFTPATGFDPVLEIRARADPRPYRVNVYAYGPLSKPQLLLTSSPPLPENEIMTLLATGTTSAGLEDTQAASSRAMQLVIEEFRRGRFAGSKHLRPLMGLLDRVDFSLAEADPYSGESFSTATIHLSDRWYVTAGMGAEGDTRLMGIWRISFR